MTRIAAFVLGLALALASFGAVLASPPPVAAATKSTVGATPLDRGHSSGLRGKTEEALRSNADWKKLWERHSSNVLPQPPLPAVDFSKEMVIAVSLGARNSGGYSVSITSIVDDGTNVVVTYKETKPNPGGVYTAAITHPFVFVKVPLTSKPVKFVEAK